MPWWGWLLISLGGLGLFYVSVMLVVFWIIKDLFDGWL